jgi:CDP-diacylglycerol--glycerol-3-phosphate 3-phosphatidyltransferase
MLAREHDMKTPLGALLNELGDIFSDSALYLPFALLPGVTPVYVVAVVWLAVVSETTGILGAVIGASRRYDGPMGKSDRAFVFSVVAVILACGVEPGVWLDLVWGILVILLAFTIVNRGREALAELA